MSQDLILAVVEWTTKGLIPAFWAVAATALFALWLRWGRLPWRHRAVLIGLAALTARWGWKDISWYMNATWELIGLWNNTEWAMMEYGFCIVFVFFIYEVYIRPLFLIALEIERMEKRTGRHACL